jgi:hypothetical protein
MQPIALELIAPIKLNATSNESIVIAKVIIRAHKKNVQRENLLSYFSYSSFFYYN